MSDYYSGPVRSGVTTDKPTTPANEKHTTAVYYGPPQVFSGAGTSPSQYPQSNDDGGLPSYPEQQLTPGQEAPPPTTTPNEKRLFQQQQQDSHVNTLPTTSLNNQMSDYYAAPVRSGMITEKPATPGNEILTTAVYHGPPQVVGGAGRPMSQYPQSNDGGILPSYPSQQPTPAPEAPIKTTPNEKHSSQQQQQDSQVIPIGLLDQNPGFIKCPECGESHLTNTTRVIGGTNQLSYFQPPFFWRWTDIYGSMWALLATLVAACFVPYMMNSLKNVEHRCSNCDVHLATWYRSSGTRQINRKEKPSKKK
jgi:lipopolysaccharide-induced tumor necrosis factor-alpha factor